MTFTIVDEDAMEFDTAVTSVDAWYDMHTRLWVVQLLNKDGYQVGDAQYVYGKTEAKAVKAELEKEYNI